MEVSHLTPFWTFPIVPTIVVRAGEFPGVGHVHVLYLGNDKTELISIQGLGLTFFLLYLSFSHRDRPHCQGRSTAKKFGVC